MVPLGQKSENFCGATQIDDHSSARQRANTRLSLVTGESPSVLTGESPVQPALRSPFSKVLSAAIPPPAALWERFVLPTRLRHRFCSSELGASALREKPLVNAPRSTFLDVTKIRKITGTVFMEYRKAGRRYLLPAGAVISDIQIQSYKTTV